MARVTPLLPAVAAALLVFCTFPRGLIPLNDAFGYVRSIALTYEHGRPWTDGWLEPWSAGFSSLGALVFTLTGSMYLATFGVCAVLMGLAMWACCRLLVVRAVTIPVAVAVSVLLLFFPTILWKFLEVNGFSLYFTCLLLALLCYERKNWVGFTLAWCLAISTRQSAVAWGVLPAYAAIAGWPNRSATGLAPMLRPLATVVIAAVFFLFLTQFMNRTHAQIVVTEPLLAHWSLQGSMLTLTIALLVIGVAFGLGNIVWGERWQDSTPRWRRAVAGLLGFLVIVGSLSGDLRAKIDFDHAAFAVPLFYIYLKGLCLLGGIGVLLGAMRFRFDFLLGALACTLVLLLRNVTWDYYLADVFVFAFFAVPSAGRVTEKFRPLPCVLGTLAVLSLSFVVFFKMRYDREYAVGTLGVRALNRGAVPWQDASFLPFGVMGWYFYPYYSSHEGRDTADLADFGRYLRHDVIGTATRYPRLLRKLSAFEGTIPSDRSTVVERGRFSFCWFFEVDFALVRLPESSMQPAKTPYPVDLVPPVLPLDDAGWRAQLKR